MYTADLALVNARILTMEPATPVAEAALVRGGRIALVGTSAEVAAAAGGSPVFDAGGRTAVPGFIDGHSHFEMTCSALTHSLRCQTPPYRSLREIAGVIRERASSTPPGRWLIARSSFSLQEKVEERRLFAREELDAITTEHSIVVFAGFHVAMMNTRAFKELNLWEPGHEPRGALVHRDGSGTPTGVATEIWPLLPPYSLEEVTSGLRTQARDLFVANGVTSVYSIPFSGDDVRAERALQASGELPLRLRSYYHVPDRISMEAILATGLESGFGNDTFRFGGVKIFVDGEAGDGLGNPREDLKWSQAELDAFVEQAHRAGLQIWMHAVSPKAVRMAAQAVESAVARHGGTHRHRVEHGGDYLGLADLAAIGRSGVLLVSTPQFIYSAGDAVTADYTPLRSVLDAGFEVVGASDSTGTVPDGIAPLFNIACAVTRRTGRGSIAGPEERITAGEALRMFTIWAARGGFEADEKGSIAAGKFGDFAVLSADPLAVEPDGLFEVKVDATILGGEVVYRRAGL